MRSRQKHFELGAIHSVATVFDGLDVPDSTDRFAALQSTMPWIPDSIVTKLAEEL